MPQSSILKFLSTPHVYGPLTAKLLQLKPPKYLILAYCGVSLLKLQYV